VPTAKEDTALIGDKTYRTQPYSGRRGRVMGSFICECEDLREVLDYFCVCSFRTYCDKHGLRCVGTHD
jgi:hypothetical protein